MSDCVDCGNSGSLPIGPPGKDGLFGGYSSKWVFSEVNSDHPASGTLRLDTSTVSSVSEIYINILNFSAIDLYDFLVSFNNDGNYGYIRLFKEFESATFAYFKITGVDNTLYTNTVTKLTVEYIDGNGSFSVNNNVILSFTPKGVPGTNSFKFIKEFESNLDGGVIEIDYSEIISCSEIPQGCLAEGTESDLFRALHIQVWITINEDPLETFWSLADSSSIASIKNNKTTGKITITFTGGSIDILARVVIIG